MLCCYFLCVTVSWTRAPQIASALCALVQGVILWRRCFRSSSLPLRRPPLTLAPATPMPALPTSQVPGSSPLPSCTALHLPLCWRRDGSLAGLLFGAPVDDSVVCMCCGEIREDKGRGGGAGIVRVCFVDAQVQVSCVVTPTPTRRTAGCPRSCRWCSSIQPSQSVARTGSC